MDIQYILLILYPEFDIHSLFSWLTTNFDQFYF